MSRSGGGGRHGTPTKYTPSRQSVYELLRGVNDTSLGSGSYLINGENKRRRKKNYEIEFRLDGTSSEEEEEEEKEGDEGIEGKQEEELEVDNDDDVEEEKEEVEREEEEVEREEEVEVEKEREEADVEELEVEDPFSSLDKLPKERMMESRANDEKERDEEDCYYEDDGELERRNSWVDLGEEEEGEDARSSSSSSISTSSGSSAGTPASTNAFFEEPRMSDLEKEIHEEERRLGEARKSMQNEKYLEILKQQREQLQKRREEEARKKAAALRLAETPNHASPLVQRRAEGLPLSPTSATSSPSTKHLKRHSEPPITSDSIGAGIVILFFLHPS